jgi:hypothetical protein
MKTIWNRRRTGRAVAVVATVVTGAALASAGFAGMRALDLGPAAATQYPGKKVNVCHRTHSKKHPWVKIRISKKALKAHLRHGDFVVDANHPCPPTNAAAKHKKHKKHNKAGAKKKHKSEAAAKKEHGNGGNGGNGKGGGNDKHGKK